MKEKLKNFERVLGMALVLVLCMVCFNAPVTAQAAETSGTCGENVTWTYDEATGTLTISGEGAMSKYKSTFGDPDAPWYNFHNEISKVVIEDGVTSIGQGAFKDCGSLTEVTIPDSVTTIDYDAFAGCSSLTEITIPDGVTTIGGWAFAGCSSLTEITIPDSVTSIGRVAFAQCTSLTKVTIPDSVTSIEFETFSHCTSLTEITIPDSVTYIGQGAINYCTSLTEITIPDSVTTIGSCAFSHCTSLTEITIPDSVTTIRDHAFWYCSSLTEITIPDSVTTIRNDAFLKCPKLTTVNFGCQCYNQWKEIVDSGDFYGATNIETVNMYHAENLVADDAEKTITVACEKCGEILGTVTLLDPDADAKIMYDGTSKTAKYEGEIPGETPVITYTGVTATNGEAVKAGTYTATMTVGGQKVSVQFVIEKLEWAPNAPQKTITVPYTVAKVKDVVLPENWVWQKSYTDLELTVGAVTEATAVYNGADKGNYKNEAIVVEITCAACVHEGGVATCVDKATCDVCGEQYGELDATNHGDTELKNVAEATCTENGYTGDTCCKDCGAVLEQGKAIEAKGHVGGTATCTEKATCEVCGEKYNEVNATNHGEKEVRNQVKATCTEAGYTGDTCCKDCGYVFASGETVAAKGHVYTSAVTKEPTVTETGVLTYTCANCDDTYTEVIEKLPNPAQGVVAEVTYATHWGNGGQVEITLTNGGEDLIGGWNVELDLNITGELTNSWGDGYVTSFKDGHVTIKNQDWVQNFEAGTTKKVYLQYNGTLPGFVTCTQNGDALVASINYLNHWGNGGQIEILLENTGAALADGWGTELTINLTGKMEGTWGDGFVTSYENGHIVIKNQDWVKNFETGTKKSVWLQFNGILPVEASNVVIK